MLPLLLLLVLSCVAPSLANFPLGRRCIKSADGKYLRVWKGPEGKVDWHADLAPHCLENERWTLVDRRGFVSFQSEDGQFLSAREDGSVKVVKTEGEAEMWQAFLNEDGTNAFLSTDGRWLSAYDKDGWVKTMPHNKEWEHFKLEAWNTTSSRNMPARHPIPIRFLGEKCIRSTYDSRFIQVWQNGDASNGDWRADLEPTCSKDELLILERRDGWATIRTKDNLYLRSTPAGTVHFVEGLARADKLEALLNPDGSLSFQSPSGHWLSSFRPDGFVRTMPHNLDMERFTIEDWNEKFDTAEATTQSEPEDTTTAGSTTEATPTPAVEALLKACDGRHIFQTVHGAYLRAGTKDTEGIVDQAPAPIRWERWTVNSTGGDKITLESYHGTYLRAYPDGAFDLAPHARSYEQWTVIKNDDNTFSLQSPHGGFLSASANGTLRIKPERGSWDHYSIGCWTTDAPEPVTTVAPPTPTTTEAPSSVVSKLLNGCKARFAVELVGAPSDAARYLQVRPTGQILLARNPLGWERFAVTSAGGNKVRLNSFFGKFMTSQKNDTLSWNDVARSEDYWELTPTKDAATFEITSAHGAPLAVRNGSAFLANPITRQARQQFKFICATVFAKTTPAASTTTTTRPTPVSTTSTTRSTTTEKTTTTPYETPAERIVGAYCLKGVNLGKDVYVRADRKSSGAVYVSPNCERNEHFVIAQRHGRVTIRSVWNYFLHAHANGYVDAELASAHIPTLWAPFDNDDGTWSFQSEDGRWLSSHEPNGTMTTMPRNKALEHFRLEAVKVFVAEP